MEDKENANPSVLHGEITGIQFALASHREICTASISDSAISHASQLSNPFLGLPLEFGKCESCGASEAGQCEGHFGYIKLPVPVYHPSHVHELKRMLCLICLNCLKPKQNKRSTKGSDIALRLLPSCCVDAPQFSIKEVKTMDGANFLELRLPSRSKLYGGSWKFLDKYGFRYGNDVSRILLPIEVSEILKRIPEVTRKKLIGKGCHPQEGYIIEYLPVPPNCLSVPEVSDGITVISLDPSKTLLKKVLGKIKTIESSRSGVPNFESHKVEASELQVLVDQYLQIRGTTKSSRDIETRFGVTKELSDSSTKAWLEKMRTLVISKGTGFSSRSVITGDAYKKVSEIGIPVEVAQRITFEEKVNVHNISYLQELVDNNFCLTFSEGLSTYSLREGSKGHTILRPGQIVHRRIMDGDIVFINRPPTTHKHSLQALSVYIHDDHTVKINPLICGPLGADFDGDCVHLFYPQSLAAKAEVMELFSVDKQLLSSHSGNLNLQFGTDSLLSLKMLFRRYFLDRVEAQNFAMFLSPSLSKPVLVKAETAGPHWTVLQILESVLPPSFACIGDQYLIKDSEIFQLDLDKDMIPSVVNEIAASILFGKGPAEVLNFFNLLQPFLMESLFSEGFSVTLEDFSISAGILRSVSRSIKDFSHLLFHLRSRHNDLVELQIEKHIRDAKQLVTKSLVKSSSLGFLVDSKSDSSVNKVVQQIGFLGRQLFDSGKFYSKSLIEDVATLFNRKYCHDEFEYPSAEYGLIKGCFIHGLDPYEEIVHSISTREVIVRSSRGLSEPGLLFKNLMSILRDVVVCYDGTVRNVCNSSIVQFDYGSQSESNTQPLFPAGEPVGVLAATAISNPAYKAVLDASPSSNSSWDMMKEILLCKVGFKDEPINRRVILYLNSCGCRRQYCQERAAYLVKNQLKKICLQDAAIDFTIEYKTPRPGSDNPETDAGLLGHIHLNEMLLKELQIRVSEILQMCQDALNLFRKKKKVGQIFSRTVLSVSECHSYQQSSLSCLTFFWQDGADCSLETISNILASVICPVLLKTVIKGDPRISSANIIWINPNINIWVRNPYGSPEGELALDVTLEKTAVKQSGDAWRIILDSCLPVIHLIDTKRSIPYAVKQIQELLGITCAFDQAIQRLASSVAAVAKGVLKEHLILLASSMTCAGELVGFNIGGYKLISRSLNTQVPFTEATLYTPKTCFERAAEKAHMDSLSSIVGSCSWGKHVAVGTGSGFDLLWGTRQVGLNQKSGTDVCRFLHMVKGASEETNTACLGADVDDMLFGDDNGDWAMSPEDTLGINRPVFEDYPESVKALETGPVESTWEMVSNLTMHSSDANGVTKSDVWSSWGKDEATADATEKDLALPPGTTNDSAKSNGWDAVASGTSKANDSVSSWAKKENFSDGHDVSVNGKTDLPGISWEKRADDSTVRHDDRNTDNAGSSLGKKNVNHANDDTSWGRKHDDSNMSWALKADGSGATWGKKTDDSAPFGKKANDSSAPWGNKADESSTTWGKKADDPCAPQGKKADSSVPWGEKTNDSSEPWGKKADDSGAPWGKKADDSGAPWGKKADNSGAPWGKKVADDSGAPWGKKVADDSGATWGKKVADDSGAPWGKKVADVSGAPWGKKVDDSGAPWGKKVDDSGAPWGKKTDDGAPFGKKANDSSAPWGNKADDSGAPWGKKADDSGAPWGKKADDSGAPWGKKADDSVALWGKKVDESGGPWGKKADESGASWGKKADDSGAVWGKKVDESDASQGNKTDASSAAWGKKVHRPDASWDRKAEEFCASGQKNPEEPGASWSGKIKDSDQSKGKNAEGTVDLSWGKRSPGNESWHSQNDGNEPDSWASQATAGKSENEPDIPWGRRGKGSFKRSQGWSSSTGDRYNKNRPPRPPGKNNDDFSANGMYTATKQRLEIFTSDEQHILTAVDPIMHSIRRIMHQPGYNDGDPLAAEDQSFILERVFSYHPDKEAKMGPGIDHVMVSKHGNFQDTRCFYIVRSDGQKEDFSYRKCLEKFIKDSYADAESFIGKYFFKLQGGGNRERGQSPSWRRTPELDTQE